MNQNGLRHAHVTENNVFNYRSKYLEILSAYLFPSEEFTFDVVDGSDQLDFSVLEIPRNTSSSTVELEQ